jgi:hypothetical protein
MVDQDSTGSVDPDPGKPKLPLKKVLHGVLRRNVTHILTKNFDFLTANIPNFSFKKTGSGSISGNSSSDAQTELQYCDKPSQTRRIFDIPVVCSAESTA